MGYRILILGASYGSLLGTKLIMAGHDVTLVCRSKTAQLINSKGTEVRIKLRDESDHRTVRSADQPGQLNALTPDDVHPASFDLVALAMQEPQYGSQEIWQLMQRIADARVPCISLMNMPPLPYLRRIEGLDTKTLEECFTNPRVWDGFEPDLFTLCSPDPQAFRPPEEGANVLHVNLPTNFKTAAFGKEEHNVMLRELETDIAAVRLHGKDVPVKLRVHESLFTPFAKWSMLMTGNYRCVTDDGVQSIFDAVHGDLGLSAEVYAYVDHVVRRLGAAKDDQVPFVKYARAAENLVKPSSAARAILAGATNIERVDRLVQLIGGQFGLAEETVDRTVALIDTALDRNRLRSA